MWILTAVCLLTGVLGQDINRFPPDFKFGAATASYQVEGGWDADGKGVNIWDTLTHEHPEYITDRSNGDVAADSYHKIKEDVECLRQLRVHFYRFSISWARILPTGLVNKVNSPGIQYYNNLIDELLRNNIEPVISMYHWDLPQPLQDLGGWANPYLADYFEDYARILYQEFGDRVKLWITINEPHMVARGYSDQHHGMAPNVGQPGIADYLASYTMLLAHAKAYKLYYREFRHQKGKVGITYSANWNEPMTNSTEDIAAAERAMQFELGLHAHPIFSQTGGFPPVVKEYVARNSKAEGFYRSRLPVLSQQEIDYIRGTSDFFGLNHYTTNLVHEGLPELTPSQKRDVGAFKPLDQTCAQAKSKWLMVVPWGFRKLLIWIKEQYDNPPVFVMENGYSDDGQLDDHDRIHYYVEYITAMQQAIYLDGCNVIGYTVWSLLDNFQWNQGYLEKFGLFQVNFTDPARPRAAKDSSKVFADLVTTGKIPMQYLDYSKHSDINCQPVVPI